MSLPQTVSAMVVVEVQVAIWLDLANVAGCARRVIETLTQRPPIDHTTAKMNLMKQPGV